MAERLTESEVSKSFTEQELRTSEQARIYQKLGQLEDILEKYGVESVEELSKIFSYLSGRFINSVYSLKHKFDSYEDKIKYLANKKGQYYEELYETKQDRDTWQKACELACDTLKQVMGKPLWIGGNIPTPEVKDSKYFYQQAKTEGNYEND